MKGIGLIALLLGLAATGLALRQALVSTGAADSARAASAPKKTLDNVRQKASAIEQDAQQRADQLEKKADSQ